MRFQNDIDAERWFRAALSDDVTRPYAEAGLGTVEGFRGNIDAAEAHFEAAIYLVSYDFNIWMDYAQFWALRTSESRDLGERALFARRLEESLRNALTISDATPELNSLMGYSYLARGKDIDEAIDFLEAAVRESPIDQNSRLLLASAYMMFRQFRAGHRDGRNRVDVRARRQPDDGRGARPHRPGDDADGLGQAERGAIGYFRALIDIILRLS